MSQLPPTSTTAPHHKPLLPSVAGLITKCCSWALVVGLTCYILWQPLAVRIRGLLDPFAISGDALQHIAPLWFVNSPTAEVSDYTMRYYLEAILPPLFKAIYAALGGLGLSPAESSKVVAVALTLLFVTISTKTALKLAGPAAAGITLFLAAGAAIKNAYFIGGIQRGFGFLIAALALNLLISGRAIPLALLATAGALLYPASAVLTLSLLGLLAVLPARYRGDLENLKPFKRAKLIIATTLAVGLAVAPQIIGGNRYGERLSLSAANEYPEWGPSGRYTPGDRGVPIRLLKRALSITTSVLSVNNRERHRDNESRTPPSKAATESQPGAHLWIIACSCISALGVLVYRRFSLTPEALRCVVFGIGAILAFTAAQITFPLLYIPSRYLALGIIPLTPVIFPAIWGLAVKSITKGWARRFTTLVTIALAALALIALGWPQLTLKPTQTAAGHRALFAAISDLSPDAVIATWPRGVANTIPLFTARSVLVFEEGHQIFHRDYLEEMRRRTRGLIALFSANDIGPLNELKDRFKVSHLLIPKKYLNKNPSYFAPFDEEMKQSRKALAESANGKELLLKKLLKQRAIFTSGDHVLIDVKPSAGDF